jgi:hypothetical protein
VNCTGVLSLAELGGGAEIVELVVKYVGVRTVEPGLDGRMDVDGEGGTWSCPSEIWVTGSGPVAILEVDAERGVSAVEEGGAGDERSEMMLLGAGAEAEDRLGGGDEGVDVPRELGGGAGAAELEGTGVGTEAGGVEDGAGVDDGGGGATSLVVAGLSTAA